MMVESASECTVYEAHTRSILGTSGVGKVQRPFCEDILLMTIEKFSQLRKWKGPDGSVLEDSKNGESYLRFYLKGFML